MKKYIIEGGVNFYDELYNSLYFDDKSSDENNNFENICQITGLNLTDRHIKLECGHVFNYEPLYKEIYRQKFIFHSYSFDSLSKTDQCNIKEQNKDYFIKCPYCRSIQFTLLPYYDDLGLDKRYGINSLEKTEQDKNFLLKVYPIAKTASSGYYRYGYHFKPGPCCKALYNKDNQTIYCSSNFSASLANSDKTYCPNHIKNAITEYKIEKKMKLMEEKKKIKEEKVKLMEEKKNMKEAEKKKIKEEKMKTKEEEINTSTNISQYCVVVLKTGKNKGNPCGNAIHDNNMCRRHLKMYGNVENNINEV